MPTTIYSLRELRRLIRCRVTGLLSLRDMLSPSMHDALSDESRIVTHRHPGFLARCEDGSLPRYRFIQMFHNSERTQDSPVRLQAISHHGVESDLRKMSKDLDEVFDGISDWHFVNSISEAQNDFKSIQNYILTDINGRFFTLKERYGDLKPTDVAHYSVIRNTNGDVLALLGVVSGSVSDALIAVSPLIGNTRKAMEFCIK